MKRSLRQLARELEVSPSFLSMIISGKRKCPDRIKGAVYSFTNVDNTKPDSAWEADALPLSYSRSNHNNFILKQADCKV